MSLTGSRIGPYEVGALLGAGGMGEVYRARDSKLGREVALKVLPTEFSSDPDRLARLHREAHVLASLNHPNIAAIYGFEDAGDVHALVLELVEGETLADRIGRGRLDRDEALPIARQITDALEAAHEHGIIHRDLKPANIKVRDDGTVKVLDFGLAKLAETGVASGFSRKDLSMSPTLSLHATHAGMILGTAAYMSPEQARGKVVDKRSDIWAFGCVLFEMLTGARAFEGEEVSDILAAVLRAEPDFAKLPVATPPSIRRLLQRCFEKDRRERLPDIGTARLEIKDALATPAETIVSAAARPRDRVIASPRVAWSAAAVACAIAIGAAVLTTLNLRTEPPVPPIARFQILPPNDGSFVVGGTGPLMAMSPDGPQLAFVAASGDGTSRQLWLRRMDATEGSPVPGTEGADTPFWSPDSRSVAFFAGTQLKRIDVSGGPPQIVCDLPAGGGVAGASSGAWNREGTILFFYSVGTGVLYRVSANGGAPTPATTLDESRGETAHIWPRFLPDGRRFLYWANSAKPQNRGIALGSMDSTETRFILASESAADFASPNYLLFRRGSALFAQTVNLEDLQLEGDAFRVADPVGALTTLGRPGFSVSDTGVLAFWPFASPNEGDTELAIYDRTGKPTASLGVSLYRGIDLSPDGTRLAVHLDDDSGGDVWVLDLQRGTRPRLTFDASQHNSSPIWSPDGSRIAFASLRSGMWGLYEKPSSGTGREDLLFESRTVKAPSSYAPDGRSLLFEIVDPTTRADLWWLPLNGDRKPLPYLQSRFTERRGQISQDGRWVAYVSDESGRGEVYVQGVSNAAAKWQVSTDGAGPARWRQDGKELFYTSGNRMLSVDVEPAGDGLRFGTPRVLFQYPFRNPRTDATPYHLYAVSADGQRFFMQAPVASESASVPLTIVLNWTSALKQ